ncbi:MAG: Plasmid stabilization system protein [Syntrophorhabdaceae bacterium PtaU1.Bin034]|jgi:plasmid stabilization system protein ParE|nr:MAG: Plasmid stabilization system protein [Syntrophorhabdaceae bacterium PtaU1.Bin034]
MDLEWTTEALSDLARLYDFLAPVNKRAAARTVQTLVAAPNTLKEHPRIGEPIDEFQPREVRRILAGDYEIRYEIQKSTVSILRIWHTREDR